VVKSLLYGIAVGSLVLVMPCRTQAGGESELCRYWGFGVGDGYHSCAGWLPYADSRCGAVCGSGCSMTHCSTIPLPAGRGCCAPHLAPYRVTCSMPVSARPGRPSAANSFPQRTVSRPQRPMSRPWEVVAAQRNPAPVALPPFAQRRQPTRPAPAVRTSQPRPQPVLQPRPYPLAFGPLASAPTTSPRSRSVVVPVRPLRAYPITPSRPPADHKVARSPAGPRPLPHARSAARPGSRPMNVPASPSRRATVVRSPRPLPGRPPQFSHRVAQPTPAVPASYARQAPTMAAPAVHRSARPALPVALSYTGRRALPAAPRAYGASPAQPATVTIQPPAAAANVSTATSGVNYYLLGGARPSQGSTLH
jgi:hypothetical protein